MSTLNFKKYFCNFQFFLFKGPCFFLVTKGRDDNNQALVPWALKRLVGEEDDGVSFLGDQFL